MTIQKTIRKKVVRKQPTSTRDVRNTQALSSTMPIPVQELYDEVASRHECNIRMEIPNHPPRLIRLDKEPLTLGRDSGCDIILNITNVSRQHARILCNEEEYQIEDLDSTNGTFVNNVRIRRCVLRDQDQIRIGEARLLFQKRRVRQ
ncbi:MAG: hypothetical protein A2498_03200 [Lentisphaerae bacterium RIFOXYC12_FULL_60_16]|nr:MAG: hypothetical protein A2498_03200 [Lentisphaerae bacterium RIFOXYC12_FULL_60_16]OGV72042.1 MAG: hypothetical protein A2269_00085 [Lentisphaerae bacterium RIFOXYA12_FULL_60_10]OGV85268.1 MAG: hypothetical protein A2340_01685 [Lentisphaerae bacterium RIFOXYB12_FULL_60_10]